MDFLCSRDQEARTLGPVIAETAWHQVPEPNIVQQGLVPRGLPRYWVVVSGEATESNMLTRGNI
jgi:hypothetical protein